MLAISREEVARLQAEVARLTAMLPNASDAMSDCDGMAITLPYPPTVNMYWRSRWTGKYVKHYISNEGTKFRKDVIRSLHDWDMILGPLSVRMLVFPPDRKARDVDNILKAPLDALEHAGVFENDSQIEELYVRKMREPSPPGRVEVTVSQVVAGRQLELI